MKSPRFRKCTKRNVTPGRTCKWFKWVKAHANDLMKNPYKPWDYVFLRPEDPIVPWWDKNKRGVVLNLCSCGWGGQPHQGTWILFDGDDLPRLMHYKWLEKLSVLDKIVEATSG